MRTESRLPTPPADEAWDHVFGYPILLDISVRGDQDRSNHTSYDTFTVVGPCVVTPDEVGDPQNPRMELQLTGETRQDEPTSDVVYTCVDVVQYASIGTTLEAGDATARHVRFAAVDVTKGGQT